MDTIDFNRFEIIKTSFCVEECVKSYTKELSSHEKSCVETCFKTMENALTIAQDIEAQKQ